MRGEQGQPTRNEIWLNWQGLPEGNIHMGGKTVTKRTAILAAAGLAACTAATGAAAQNSGTVTSNLYTSSSLSTDVRQSCERMHIGVDASTLKAKCNYSSEGNVTRRWSSLNLQNEVVCGHNDQWPTGFVVISEWVPAHEIEVFGDRESMYVGLSTNGASYKLKGTCTYEHPNDGLENTSVWRDTFIKEHVENVNGVLTLITDE